MLSFCVLYLALLNRHLPLAFLGWPSFYLVSAFFSYSTCAPSAPIRTAVFFVRAIALCSPPEPCTPRFTTRPPSPPFSAPCRLATHGPHHFCLVAPAFPSQLFYASFSASVTSGLAVFSPVPMVPPHVSTRGPTALLASFSFFSGAPAIFRRLSSFLFPPPLRCYSITRLPHTLFIAPLPAPYPTHTVRLCFLFLALAPARPAPVNSLHAISFTVPFSVILSPAWQLGWTFSQVPTISPLARLQSLCGCFLSHPP